MMHRPHGDAERPAILTIWCGATNAWRSTAVIPVDGAPIRINGPTNSHGTTPVESVTALLTRLFSRLLDEPCPMTTVSIEQVEVEALASPADGLSNAEVRRIAAYIYAEVGDEPLGDLAQCRTTVQQQWYDAVRGALRTDAPMAARAD